MPSEAIPSYFSEERLWQSWLDVEAALARVQAKAGIVPDWAAHDINKAANLDQLDLNGLRHDIQRTMAPVHALARSLAARTPRCLCARHTLTHHAPPPPRSARTPRPGAAAPPHHRAAATAAGAADANRSGGTLRLGRA